MRYLIVLLMLLVLPGCGPPDQPKRPPCCAAVGLHDGTAFDPVCGMLVTKDSAIVLHYGTATYYFCSKRCKEQFIWRNKW